MCRILLRQRDQHPPFSQSRAGDRSGFSEVEVNMGAWEDFHQDWRVYCLLQSVTEPEPPDDSPRERARASRSGGPLISVGQVTGHLGRELLDAVRIHALVLGIVIDSAHADIAVLPLVQASAEVPGDQPWIRYKLTLDARATEAQLLELHQRVLCTCVRRLESEYEAPIAGNVVNVRTADSPE
jgi:hypothetical protein